MPDPMMAWRRNLLLILLLSAGLLISGCLLQRVYAFKRQFCDYGRNFELVVGDEIRLNMRNPVLLDSDVVWLIGAEPTREARTGLAVEMTYVVEKDLPLSSDEYAIPLHLHFTPHDGDFRLSAGVIDRNLGAMITPGLIQETVSHTCGSATSLVDRSVTVDLSGLEPADIPTRNEIIDALGAPASTSQDGREAHYRFRLRDAKPGVEKSFARVRYDTNGRVEHVVFRYLRYQLDADLVAGIGVVTVDL